MGSTNDRLFGSKFGSTKLVDRKPSEYVEAIAEQTDEQPESSQAPSREVDYAVNVNKRKDLEEAFGFGSVKKDEMAKYKNQSKLT